VTGLGRKAVRDFSQERVRTALVVLAIALGISGFAAVLASYAILTRALNEGYLGTNPASATLRTDRVDDELLAAARSHPQIGEAEARGVVTGRIKTGPVEWRNLTLFVMRDFGDIRVSTLKREQGAWPPDAGEMLIERDALQVARARIGDAVTVRTSGGEDRMLRVTGSVHDVGQAQARMENVVYGYVTLDTSKQLGEEPYLDQLKFVVRENRFDEGHVHAVAEEVRKLVESGGHPVLRMDVPKPGKHPHAEINGLLLLALAAFGLFVLVLSGVLVINLLTALMASQVRQIGVMKVIGGTRGQIARIYLSQALLLGVVAIVVALPLGILGCRALCRSMAVFLNFDIDSFAAPAWVYLCVVGVGLVVPLLAAAYPVWKGSGVSALEALADFGVSRSSFGTTRFDRLLSGMGGLGRPVLFAVRNTFRRRTRTGLTLLTLAAGGLFFMAALNVRASMINTLDRLFAARRFDLAVGLGSMYPFERVERAIRNTPGVVRAEGWITTEGALPPRDREAGATAATTPHAGTTAARLHGAAASATDRFSVIALPPETELLKLNIVRGRNLQTADADSLVANTALAAKSPQIRVGQTVSVRLGHFETSLRVVGIAREPFASAVAYIPRRYIEERGGHAGMANSLRLVLADTDVASLERVKVSLDRNLEREGVRALSSLSNADSRYGFDQHMVMIYVALIIMSCVIGGVGGLGLMITMSLNVLERRREMGILRAVGASPRAVWLIVVAESVVIGMLSWGLAGLAAWPLSKGLGNHLALAAFGGGLDFTFELRGLLIWLAVSIGLAALSSFLPAWRASRSVVREALAYE
jgi:putative ABC transport system permease protein